MDKFEFDPLKHEYKLNGVILPSVTQILKEVGFYSYGFVNQEVLQRAAKFGNAVHRACQLDDHDNLGKCDPSVLKYVEGWRRFKKDFGADFGIIEGRLYSKKYLFAGTPDRQLIIQNVLIDIKTGQKEPWHAIQKGGYKILIAENRPDLKVRKKWTVYLKPDDYKLDDHKNGIEENIFLSALQICKWKKQNNVKGKEK